MLFLLSPYLPGAFLYIYIKSKTSMSNKAPNLEQSQPWYKHFWVWYIIFMKLAVITAIAVTVSLIVRNPTSMVVDDYYNEGRAINFKIDRLEKAAELNIKIQVAPIDDHMLSVRFTSGEPEERTALRVIFYHPTLDEQDFEVLVPHASGGEYRAELPKDLKGHWRVDVEPFTREWRVSRNLTFPLKKPELIIPAV